VGGCIDGWQGVLATIQDRFRACFNCVIDAFVCKLLCIRVSALARELVCISTPARKSMHDCITNEVDFSRPVSVIDLDGNDMITPSEFCIGMEKLMVPLKREEIQKACAVVAGLRTEKAYTNVNTQHGDTQTCERVPGRACRVGRVGMGQAWQGWVFGPCLPGSRTQQNAAACSCTRTRVC
jgi:hypothetical protein